MDPETQNNMWQSIWASIATALLAMLGKISHQRGKSERPQLPPEPARVVLDIQPVLDAVKNVNESIAVMNKETLRLAIGLEASEKQLQAMGNTITTLEANLENAIADIDQMRRSDDRQWETINKFGTQLAELRGRVDAHLKYGSGKE